MDLLICPCCSRDSLRLVVSEKDEDEIVEGKIICAKCNEEFPIHRTFPILLASEKDKKKALGRFDATTEYEEYFLATTKKVEYLVKRSSEGLCVDLGCGSGAYVNSFNGNLVCVDIIPYFLLKTKENYHVKNKVYYIVADVRNLPLKNNSFDFVFCSQVLEHLGQRYISSTLKEFERICKGTIQLDVPNESRIAGIPRRFLSILGFYETAERETYELHHHSKFSVNDLKEFGLSVYGCIGGPTRRHVNIYIWDILWDMYDFFVWHFPIFAGTLIAVKRLKERIDSPQAYLQGSMWVCKHRVNLEGRF